MLDKNIWYYLAGPMTGIPQSNFPLFDRVAKLLREQGFKIVTPSELDLPHVRKEAMASETGTAHASQWGEFLSRDVKVIADGVGGIILLPDWQVSRGAKLEAFVGLLTNKKFAWYDELRKSAFEKSSNSVRITLIGNMP
jgi:hypothetical protein